MTDVETTRLDLPSGGWADFRRVIEYGARMKLNRLAAQLGATASVGRDSTEAVFTLAATEIADAAVLQDYYPLIYLLTAWSFDLPLPTLEDYSSLERVPYKDGDVMVKAADKAFEGDGQVDFGANLDPKDKPHIMPSSESRISSGGTR